MTETGKNKLRSILKNGRRGKGRSTIENLLQGLRNTRQQAIEAKCYDCTCGYADGARDCEDNSCPLYEYHPYRSLEGEYEIN